VLKLLLRLRAAMLVGVLACVLVGELVVDPGGEPMREPTG
jgi:hypothetical protein